MEVFKSSVGDEWDRQGSQGDDTVGTRTLHEPKHIMAWEL